MHRTNKYIRSIISKILFYCHLNFSLLVKVWVTRRSPATRFLPNARSMSRAWREPKGDYCVEMSWNGFLCVWMWRHRGPPIRARKPVGIGPSSGETMQRAFIMRFTVFGDCMVETWRSFSRRKFAPFPRVLQIFSRIWREFSTRIYWLR